MNFSAENLQTVIGLLDQVDEFKPIVKKVVEKALEVLPEFEPLLGGFKKYVLENTVEDVKFFESNGFTRYEAMLLTMNVRFGIEELLKRYNQQRSSV